MELKQYLDENNIKYTQDSNGITIGSYLDLRGTSITALPDNLTVGISLDLRGTSITALPDNLTVGSYLDLRGTSITALPDNLTVGGYLDLRGTSITALPDNLTVVGSYLDLRGTSITALPDNLTVGGSLDLRGTSITALPDNLTVGGALYLEGTSITALPDNLTVGGYLDLEGTSITAQKNRKSLPEGFSASVEMAIELKFNAKGFTIADDILARIINSKGALKKIQIVGKKKTSWLASDGKGNHAHADTAHEAMLELSFKTEDRDISEFENMPKDTVKTPQEWAFIYRIITGACQSGTKRFIEQKGKLKKTYTLAEILEQTDGAYGSDRFKEVVGA